MEYKGISIGAVEGSKLQEMKVGLMNLIKSMSLCGRRIVSPVSECF